MPRPPLAALRGRFRCRSLWSLRQVLLSPLLSVSNPSLLSPLERGGERRGIMRRFRPAPFPLRKGAAFMPPSSGLQMALVRPWLAGMKAALFPLLRSMLPAPERLAAFIPPTSLARLKQPNANSPQKPKPPSASDELLTAHSRLLVATVCVCRLLRVFWGMWGSVTRGTTGKARGKLQPH